MKNGAERANYQPIFMFPARVMTFLVILQYPGTIEGSGKSNVIKSTAEKALAYQFQLVTSPRTDNYFVLAGCICTVVSYDA